MRNEFSAGRTTCFVWVALAFNFVFTPSIVFAKLAPEKIYRKVLPSVMTLEVENFVGEHFVGSAVMVLSDDIALTAWHVVSDARSVCAVFADGTRLKVAGCIDINAGRDLALLKLEKPLPGRKAMLSSLLQPVATRTFVIGAPKGYGFSISDGLVSQVRDVNGVVQYQISCPISPGNSGGPVLNDRGEVIGITSWTKSDGQNLNFAIPIRELARLDAAKPVVSWEQRVLDARPLPPRNTSTKTAEVLNHHPPLGYDDFAMRLKRSVGKQVTVVVEDGGEEHKYQFVVPNELRK